MNRPCSPSALLLAVLLVACADAPVDDATAPAPPTAPGAPSLSAAPGCGADCVEKSGRFAGAPGAAVEFIEFGVQQQRQAPGEALADIVTHLPAQYGNTYYDADPVTWGHETSHGIHAHVRNQNVGGPRVNAFYVLNDRAVLVQEPPIRKSAVARHVPQSLRASRFGTYITGQQAWDDTPLYVWDEWNAYVNGGEVAIDLHAQGLWDRGGRDAVEGQLEFTVYAVAVAMAVDAADPSWIDSHPQFIEFLAWNTERAMRIYRIGAELPPFQRDSQEAYLEQMRTSPDAEAWRQYARDLFGAAWTDAVLFGDGQVPDVQPPEAPEEDPLGGGGDGEPEVDADADGVPDADDLCSDSNGPVWRAGDWRGCAEGQRRDDDRPDFDAGPDADLDTVPDALDLCSATPAGARVWLSGDWLGCAEGQRRDPRVEGPDRDRDGVGDADDLCSGTSPGAAVWRVGDWLGCAEGQRRD